MKVQLTDEMIASAKPKCSWGCVIVKGLEPHFSAMTYIRVDPSDKGLGVVYIESEPGEQEVHQLTKAANRLALAFDDGKEILPQEVEVWIG